MNNKGIHTFFSLSLLLMFVVCSFFLFMLQIDGYKKVSETNEIQNHIHTPISYISNKCRKASSIYTEDNVLMFENKGYTTYIYCDNGKLMELNAINGVEFDKSMGESLFECDSFDVSMNENSIEVHFTWNGYEKVFYFKERVNVYVE